MLLQNKLIIIYETSGMHSASYSLPCIWFTLILLTCVPLKKQSVRNAEYWMVNWVCMRGEWLFIQCDCVINIHAVLWLVIYAVFWLVINAVLWLVIHAVLWLMIHAVLWLVINAVLWFVIQAVFWYVMHEYVVIGYWLHGHVLGHEARTNL